MIIDLAREERFSLGMLQVRPSTREVVAGDESQVVEPRIMQVLVALARRRGEVVSRDELTTSCWGGRIVGEDAISRCIAGVRRLAEAYGGFKLETVPRVGYRLSVDEAPVGASDAPEAAAPARKPAIYVLPFTNMSGDPEQAYFTEGVSEDIITDLSKCAEIAVISRRGSNQYKEESLDYSKIAADLNVDYILEGSVRKSGGRVRISAKLIDVANNVHAWSERYDRDISDIFAIQDEIAQSIVAALRLKLLPGEKQAIERRGTDNPDAYELFLMARQLYLKGRMGSPSGRAAMVRLCEGAVRFDSQYAPAWALMGLAQAVTAAFVAGPRTGGLEAAERALALDGRLAEAHVAKARVLMNLGDNDGARVEFNIALALNPQSPDANFNVGLLYLFQNEYKAAIPYLETAALLLAESQEPVISLITAFRAMGDADGARRGAELLRERSQKVLAHDPDDGKAMGLLAWALAVLGEHDRARELISRGMMVDPDNYEMHANFARALGAMGELDASLNILEPLLEGIDQFRLNAFLSAPDIDVVRDHPRFKALVAAAASRLARGTDAAHGP